MDHLRRNQKTYITVGLTAPIAFAAGKYSQQPIVVNPVINFNPSIDVTPTFVMPTVETPPIN